MGLRHAWTCRLGCPQVCLSVRPNWCGMEAGMKNGGELQTGGWMPRTGCHVLWGIYNKEFHLNLIFQVKVRYAWRRKSTEHISFNNLWAWLMMFKSLALWPVASICTLALSSEYIRDSLEVTQALVLALPPATLSLNKWLLIRRGAEVFDFYTVAELIFTTISVTFWWCNFKRTVYNWVLVFSSVRVKV